MPARHSLSARPPLFPRVSLVRRLCNPSQMSAVERRNSVEESDYVPEYLVRGKFGVNEEDVGKLSRPIRRSRKGEKERAEASVPRLQLPPSPSDDTRVTHGFVPLAASHRIRL